MKLEEIQKMADVDLKVDRNALDVISTDVPYLHNKYYKILTKERLTLKALEFEYNKVYRVKWKYYTTKYTFVLEKREVPTYINGDDEIIEHQKKLEIAKEKIKYLEAIIDNINKISFNIRNAIEWQKFLNGVV